jgi:hypothetical protein
MNIANRIFINNSGCFATLPNRLVSSVPVLGRGLDVRISRIPGAGRGVFTTRVFEKNEAITLYCGHLFGELQRKWMQSGSTGTHCKPLTQKLTYLDGVKTVLKGMHVGQLVNHSDTLANSKFVTIDLLPFTGERVIALKAIRAIQCGEEIYVQYGSRFWAEQQAEPIEAPEFDNESMFNC